MADDTDDSQKTEEPTHKRLEEAAKKGQMANSREINNFFMLFAFAFIILWLLPGAGKETFAHLSILLSDAHEFSVDKGNLNHMLIDLLKMMALVLVVPIVVVMAAAIFSNVIQSKFNVSAESIQPKLEKISILKGFKRLFSKRSLVEVIKGVLKISLIGAIAFNAVWPFADYLVQMPDEELGDTLIFALTMAKRMLIGVCVTMFFIAVLDYAYQYFEFMKSMRMTKQEIKDEYKQSEGDPTVKSRLRSIRMERARQRMMSSVPKADVVITNPTHYAIALQYESEKMAAPVIVAKGVDHVAMQIRKMAETNDVPIVENPPLARALYGVEIGKEVPYEHYKAVAEVISYIYRLKGKMPARAPQAARPTMVTQ